MKISVTNYKVLLGLIFGIGLFLLLSVNTIMAQSSFPAGGSDFRTATEIKPGQYQAGSLNYEDGTTTKYVYYLSGIKIGQAIEATIRFTGNTNLDVSLYDGNETKLTYVYGSEGLDKLAWLAGSTSKSDKYYLVIKNDAVDIASNIVLDLQIINNYDADSSTDAGETITEALPIILGSYQGYFSGEQGNDLKDYYSVKLKKGNQISVKITPPSADSINLAVFDVNRSRLIDNTSSGSGEIVTLSFTPANDGDYYLELECIYGCAKIVNYQLDISGAILPTGGGLLTTIPTGVVQITSVIPSAIPTIGTGGNISPTVTAKPGLLSGNTKLIVLIVGAVLVVVVIILIVFRKKPVEKNEPQMNSGSPDADKATVGYKHPCKYCDKMIPPNSRTCPFCGKNNPQGPIRCPKCNSPIEKDWKVCNNCDLPLSVKCPKCGKTTFFADYCEHCDGRLTVICPNCKTEQPPISDVCNKCKKPLIVENTK